MSRVSKEYGQIILPWAIANQSRLYSETAYLGDMRETSFTLLVVEALNQRSRTMQQASAHLKVGEQENYTDFDAVSSRTYTSPTFCVPTTQSINHKDEDVLVTFVREWSEFFAANIRRRRTSSDVRFEKR